MQRNSSESAADQAPAAGCSGSPITSQGDARGAHLRSLFADRRRGAQLVYPATSSQPQRECNLVAPVLWYTETGTERLIQERCLSLGIAPSQQHSRRPEAQQTEAPTTQRNTSAGHHDASPNADQTHLVLPGDGRLFSLLWRLLVNGSKHRLIEAPRPRRLIRWPRQRET